MCKGNVTIMDINFYNTTKYDFLKEVLYPVLDQEEKCFVVTANPEIVMQTREDPDYKKIVQSADYVIPDGIGIIKAAQWQKEPLKERIPGFELMLYLLAYADEKELSCYFLGAEERVNERVVKYVKERYPGVKIAGHHHGYFELKDEQVAESVQNVEPDLIFVALGLPRQEQWIARYMPHFKKGLFMGVGGSFDTLTGVVKRAPQKWIDLNLEWLYRFMKQPIRFKRIMKIFEFMLRVLFKRT